MNPENIYIGITDRCNADCIMCWRQDTDRNVHNELPIELLMKLIPYLEKAKEIGWWGDGEFFCYSRLYDLFNIMESLPNAKHFFSTNGMKLKDYVPQLSKINLGPIHISIDGATEGTLNRIRRGVHLKNIIEGVTVLKKECLATIWFVFTSMCSNIFELPVVVELAAILGVDKVFVISMTALRKSMLAEQLNIVAPGVEHYWFSLAMEKAEALGIKLEHTDPSRLNEINYGKSFVFNALEELYGAI